MPDTPLATAGAGGLAVPAAATDADATAPAGCIPFPATVVIDTREQAPFAFAGIRGDAREGRRPLLVRTVRAGLPSGDYSLEGFERRVAVERKSAADLFSTLGQGRARFERELERLDEYDFAAVVVEADWRELLESPPEWSKLQPITVYRSVIAWMQRYPRVHWVPIHGRRAAEVTTFRILQRFWLDHGGKK